MWGKGEFHSRGSFAVTLLDTADVWCSKLPLASASFAATQPSLPACLPSTYASNRSVAATTTLLLFSLLLCVPLTVPFCRQKCCKFELNCESPTTALINFLLNTASALTKVYHFCRSKNLGTDYGRPERKKPSLHGRKFTPNPKIFRYGGSIFCLPHRPNFSDIFDLCLHWVSVVRGLNAFK